MPALLSRGIQFLCSKQTRSADWEFVFSQISFSRTNFQLSRRNNTPTTFDTNTSHILIYSVRANTQVTGQRKRVRGDTSTEDQSFLFWWLSFLLTLAHYYITAHLAFPFFHVHFLRTFFWGGGGEFGRKIWDYSFFGKYRKWNFISFLL